GPDGALYVSDDMNGSVYRISYAAPAASSALSANPGSLTFSSQAGSSAPMSQIVTLGSGGQMSSFTAAGSAPWLQAGPVSGMTPATLTVSVNPAGLAAGSYQGSINVAATGAGASPLAILVTLIVSPSAPAAPPATPVSTSRVISHVVDGASWRTTVIVVN